MGIIAENIRKLRTGSGETQKELARTLNVAETTISMYEASKRLPDMETVQKVAKHYGVPVDGLFSECTLENDFRKFDLTREKIKSGIEIMFPIVHFDEDIQDSHLEQGYKKTLEVLEMLKKPEESHELDILVEIAHEYGLARENDPQNAKCVANFLWLSLLCYLLISDEKFKNVGKAIWNGESLQKNFYKKYMLDDPNPRNENMTKFIKDTQESISELSCIMKEDKLCGELADYYVGIRYLIGMVDNEYSTELNKVIGTEMMINYAKLGNQYAINLIEYVQSL